MTNWPHKPMKYCLTFYPDGFANDCYGDVETTAPPMLAVGDYINPRQNNRVSFPMEELKKDQYYRVVAMRHSFTDMDDFVFQYIDVSLRVESMQEVGRHD